MTTSTPEKQEGLKALQNAIETIELTVTELGGVFKVQMAPKVVTATDEAELARQMERAEAENAEVAGDDDGEEDDEGQAFSEEENEGENGVASDKDE
ncbi:hypothetical protein ILUMI_18590, partial [Ignelater luminosus]